MTTETLTLYEIRTIGFDALLRELGAVARFPLYSTIRIGARGLHAQPHETPAKETCPRDWQTDHETTSVQSKVTRSPRQKRGLLVTLLVPCKNLIPSNLL